MLVFVKHRDASDCPAIVVLGLLCRDEYQHFYLNLIFVRNDAICIDVSGAEVSF